MKFCKSCAKPLGEKRKSASYCSNGCRSIAYRKRKGLDEPDFLKTKRSGFQRSRALLTPEEEQRIKHLELEISNYTQPLLEAEAQYKLHHSLKVKYELTKVHLVPDKKGGMVEYQFIAEYPPSRPSKPNLAKPREGSVNYNERIKEYQDIMQQYELDMQKYNHNYEYWKLNKYRADIDKMVYKPFRDSKEYLTQIGQEVIDRKNEISAILGIATERTAEQTRRENEKGRFSGYDLMRMNFTTLPFDGKWKELIGTPSKSFYGLIWGDAKAGKSYFSLEFAQFLTNFGKTLYIPIEEGISHTLKKKVQDVKAKDVEMFATRDFNDIAENIEDAEFVFIDSATVINIPPESIEALRAQFPEVSFIVLLQSTKAGANFKGNQSWKHNADFILELEKIGENSTRATCTGRFGNGKIEYSY